MKRVLVALGLTLLYSTVVLAQDDARKAAAEAAAAMYSESETGKQEQKTNYWKRSVEFSLGLNQTSFTNWAAGGNNTVTLGAGVDASAKYAKGLSSWNNRAQLNYGFLWSSDKKGLIQKNNDRIKLESNFAYKTSKTSKWNYSASFDFLSQFAPGYKSYTEVDGKWVGNQVSAGLSPANINLAAGMEWVPNEWFKMEFSPITASLVLCLDSRFRKSYGMKPLDPSNPDSGYHNALFQPGARVKTDVAVSVNDVFKFETQLTLFYDYTYDSKAENASKFPFKVNWDNKISWQLAKYLKASLNTWFIYDPIVLFHTDGSTVGEHKAQFKEFLSISFTYTISNSK